MQAIVVGGGVAGAASAIALRRMGVEVTVYEAYQDPAGRVGSFLSLAVNGLRGLDALGCLEPIQAAGFEVTRHRMWSGSGKLLADVARNRLESDTLHSVTLMRGRLVEELRAKALSSGARIITGERLVNALTTADGSQLGNAGAHRVRAEFASGHTASADLLVGADGIWSATRRVLDPSAPEPRYAGLCNASGVAEGLDLEPGSWNMIYGRNGVFIFLPAPDGTIWWSAQVSLRQQPDLADLGPDRLAELFHSERQVSAILRATKVRHTPTIDHVLAEVPIWHGDRIVLLGDACHPVGSGQGASMAIEDAVVLAQQLARAASIPAALAGYDSERRARVAKMAKTAAANRDAKTAGPIARRLRDAMMPVLFPRIYPKATSWLYTHDLGTAPTTSAVG